MELTLLGTAAPAGLPRPDCTCANCTTAVGPEARAATSLLLDGVLLLDLTPGPAFAAARAGHSLTGVRQVLLSHPHEGPTQQAPAGLPAPVRVPDGQDLALISGHRVRAVALDSPGTGYLVTGPEGERLLYLPPGAAPAAPAEHSAHWGGECETVLLDVVGRPDALAGLREAGLVGGATDVLAVHLDHTVPPGRELHRRLAAAGARAVPDGTSVTVGAYPWDPQEPPLPRRTLVLGGARSGKSAEAERRLETWPGVVYVATSGVRENDADWLSRIAAHRERRPAHWRTEETCDLVPLLGREGPPLLIDCLSLWLTHAMDEVRAWDDSLWATRGAAELAARRTELVEAVRNTPRMLVAVSNETGQGVVPPTPSGRRFRDELGRLNAAVAAECEHVLLMVAGLPTVLR